VTAATPRPGTGGTHGATAPPPDPTQAATGELIGQLGDQLSRLVRDEVRLAQAEATQNAKRLGMGAGLFGGAGVLALVGKKDVDEAKPPLPTETIASVQADIDTVKKGISR
jgi:hypothetical protein